MRWFVEQLLDTGATVTALPPAVLAALAKDAVLRRPACRLRRLGAVWAAAEIAEQPPAFDGVAPLMFDLYPLGDLASLVLRRETRLEPAAIPLGPIRLEEDGGDAVFVETRLGDRRDHEGYAELLLRGPVVPRAPAGPLAANQAGFVATGLRAAPGGGAHGASLQIKTFAAMAAWPSPQKLDELYRSFPGFLDAACFVLRTLSPRSRVCRGDATSGRARVARGA
jgi:hypothetical protein